MGEADVRREGVVTAPFLPRRRDPLDGPLQPRPGAAPVGEIEEEAATVAHTDGCDDVVLDVVLVLVKVLGRNGCWHGGSLACWRVP